MKTTHESLPPSITSGNLTVMDVGISDDPEDQMMILNILANSLYTDKVSAVLREYGCNAFDANVEAGKPKVPIEVALPNKLEPTLRIRDFGYGMTQDQIKQVFCKLGRSTKRNSNKFTGMLGIGSKSGFAYGDSFMVTSWAKGTKTVYNLYRDQGKLNATPMHEEKSAEPEGIEIKVPVHLPDIPEFITKAERVFRYFKVLPKITGQRIEFKNRDPRFQGTGWRYTGTGKSFALMGNVGYDLTAAGMGLSEYDSGVVASLIRMGIELDFKIGELEIAANREGLQYKDLTKKAISDRLKVVVSEIGNIFTQQIAKAPNLWEAHKAYGEAFEKTGSGDVRQLRALVQGQILWNGKKIDRGEFNIENVKPIPGVGIYIAEKHAYYRRIQKSQYTRHCRAADTTVLVINDLPTKKNSPARVNGYFEHNPNATQLVLFTFDTPKAQADY